MSYAVTLTELIFDQTAIIYFLGIFLWIYFSIYRYLQVWAYTDQHC